MSIARVSAALWICGLSSLGCTEAPPAAENPSTMIPTTPPPTGGTSTPPTAAAGTTAPSGAAGAPVVSGAAGKTASAAAGSSAAAGAIGIPAAGSGAAAGSVATAGASAPSEGGAGITAAAGSSATAGSGAGTAGAMATAGGAAPAHEDLGKGDGKDVVTIGDSWMSYAINGGGIEAGLAAASMQRYRNYAVAGTMLLDEVIPRQYAAAKRENPDIKTIVMAGGGNDLLLTGMTAGGCGSGCMSTIDKVGARLEKLWAEMGKDGVKDIVYIEYSRGGSNKPGVEYGVKTITPICAAVSPARCHFVDSDPIIMMQLLDGVHPTADGCRKLGKATFELMVKEGMRR